MQEQKPAADPELQISEDEASIADEAREAGEETASQSEVAPEPVRDTMPDLAESLRIAELKAEEHHDAWLRAKAETENVRRRAREEVAKASKFAAEKFAQSMLPVKDSLEAALSADNISLESLREGVDLTLKQLEAAFSGAAISEENPLNARFDPNRHQAISAVESDAEPNTVIDVLQKGYLLSDRVIRPALVVVAKARNA